MDETTNQATSIEALRVIAHPARINLYELLRRHGRSTVSELASRSGLAVGSVSYHLGQMFKANLVKEVPSDKDRRQHWWEAVPGGLRWSPADFLQSHSGREISSLAQQAMTERRIRRLVRWQESWTEWDRDWIEAAMGSDSVLQLTPQDLAQMGEELHTVIRRWAERAKEQDAATQSQQEHVFVLINAFPVAEGDVEPVSGGQGKRS
ncbi:ArsR/SmtB family transcription factor [Streptomyces alfalfae]